MPRQVKSPMQGRGKPSKPRTAGLTDLGKKLPNVPVAAGDAASNKMARDAAKLVAANQISAMTANQISKKLDDLFGTGTEAGNVYRIIRTLVAKLMVALPQAAGTTLTFQTWTPASIAMYLVWAMYDSFRKAGVFTSAAMITAFPSFPEEAMVPVAFAQLLAYLKPFRGKLITAMWTDSARTALPTAPTSCAVGVAGNSFCLGDGDFSAHPYTTVSGAEAAQSTGAGHAWTDIYPQVMWLSSVIASGLSCVRYDQIPNQAPDASAYAENQSGLYGFIAFGCFTPKFNAEISYVLVETIPANASFSKSSGYSYVKQRPVHMGSHPSYFWWVENFQLCAYIPNANLKKTLRTHVWNQSSFASMRTKFSRIRVQRRKNVRKAQPVRFLIGNSIPLDPRSFQSLVAQYLVALGDTLVGAPNPGAAAGPIQDVPGIFAICMMSAYIAKVLPYCYASSQIGAVPTSTYDPRWLDIEMPVPIAAVLNSIGPVACDGRLLYPTLFANQNVDLRGTWLRFSTVGYTSNTEDCYQNLFKSANVAGITVNTYQFTAANFPVTTNYGATPIVSFESFMYAYNAVFGGATGGGGGVVGQGGNQNLTLIKPDSHNPVGKSNMLIFGDVTVVGLSANSPIICPTTSPAGNLYPAVVQIGAVASFKHMAGDELGLALVCPLVYPVNYGNTPCKVQQTGAPFQAAFVGSGRTSNLTTFIQQATTKQVAEAIAQSLAIQRRSTIELGGSTIDASQNGDLFGAIVDSLVGPLFGDAAANFIKGSPIGTIGRAISGGYAGPLAILDEIGVTDGVVSSFGLNNPAAAGSLVQGVGSMLPIAAAVL